MTEQNTSTTDQAVRGAFGGEMKYFLISMFTAAGILITSMFATVYFGGNATLGLGIGLIGGLGAFFGIYFIFYLSFWTKISAYHHNLIIIRPENYTWDVFFTEAKNGTTEEIGPDGKPTGWRNKRFILMEPMTFNPKYAEFGTVHEFVLHYYGVFKDLSELQPGTSTYRDMEIPHGSTDILTVKPVELAYLNVKHGEKIPVFQLIGGRFEGKQPENKNETTANSKGIDYKTEYEKLSIALRERERQSQEDKAWANKNEQLHMLDAGEIEGIKDLSGEMHNVMIATLQHVITTMNSLEGAMQWLQRDERKWQNILPYITAIAIFGLILGFLTINPDLMNQAVAATQNPIVNITIITIFGLTVLGIYLYKKRRRR